ncbi:FHA domain-containing protein [Marinomonas mediterranea]|jgi:type III secretion apparatus protein, YscD/HrpQ family|uniref:Type III secretion apparatus protein, YscD/HrpQ family n=1 Tax=Marinomonas mediterranea (strain ATCC 700492 / JCM 21426 / NBRC 103028 / MMB-1) TaxID=717774 RepID=F2JTD4_MARM1|nr:FHA domain-containing protein [Marinomonas mediterranea]ADZ90352.1 type III secretion apparatus protein, YscD/HrpQ family [Marinomonas mediterranea MMB-1]WCN08409.1 hypothetical protein GV055_05480 [Marinomonas mediterranea]WCN12463.1 hypothetical protein GV054_05320 [Marinomonas mediterranea]WCN16535.1 hypothetical protein GV053_05450 [Marinomonas mediterranea MMB-1]
MYELRVLSGLHRGAALPLIGQQWIIGNEDHADLTLKDDGIQNQHCQLSFIEDSWSLEPIQGHVSDSEGHVIERAEGFSLNTNFLLYGVWITVVDANTPWPVDPEIEKANLLSSKPRNHSGIGIVFGFISTAAIVATGAWAALTPEPVNRAAMNSVSSSTSLETYDTPTSTTQVSADSPQTLIADEPDQTKLLTVAELQYQLQRMLEERELDSQLGIQQSANQVTLVGELDRAQNQRLERMLNRFHQDYDTPHSIERNIDIRKPSLPFHIKQITSGPLGSIITKDGKRLFIGDELNGIRLVAIHTDKVVFKGNKTFEIAW